ncbi:RsmE family RNA methyltransferase [Candidatus Protochlamydia sp. W-9]|uniref:RsmE family RNA methyltransferase n=1 Tax=Candidatus Protochlamydia sp. W-9 TaxID=1785087 RepID=UPI00096A5793|nr:16S rRNA (uracil(1498)-N(3))-methyltransferase [Candidatus Protochlamydia sp. W-9]
MPAERFFTSEEISLHQHVVLKDNEFHHLTHVMRAKKGERVELVNGKSILAQATVLDIHKGQAVLLIDQIKTERMDSSRLILAQAYVKPDRLAFILEKGTELGVDEFWLFPGQLSFQKEIYPHQQERAQSLIIAAMKQCGRLTLPKILFKPALNQWDSIFSQAFFGDLDPHAPFLAAANEVSSYPIIFFTGPESGWSDAERQQLKKMGVQGVRLHTNILRTDTASIAALSIIQQWKFIPFK